MRVASTAPMGIPPHEVGIVVFPDRPAECRRLPRMRVGVSRAMGRFFNPIVLALMRPFIGKYQVRSVSRLHPPAVEDAAAVAEQGRDVFTYDAPAAMLFHVGPMGDPADCAIVATYAMLAAESLGLGSCMLGTSVALTRDKRLKAKYGIPAENKVGVTLLLGYPAVEFRHAIRRRLAVRTGHDVC